MLVVVVVVVDKRSLSEWVLCSGIQLLFPQNFLKECEELQIALFSPSAQLNDAAVTVPPAAHGSPLFFCPLLLPSQH